MRFFHPFLRALRARLDRINVVSTEAEVHEETWISGSRIAGPVTIGKGCKIYRADIAGNVSVDRFTSLWGPGIQLSGASHGISIGAFCSIARLCSMYETYHNPQRTTTYFVEKNLLGSPPRTDAEISGGRIHIGNDVWIGAGAQVMSGITVGNGAIVGAGAIVTHDVPPYAVIAGNPARVIRYRFTDTVIARLLETAWWNWPEERLRAESDFLMTVHDAPPR